MSLESLADIQGVVVGLGRPYDQVPVTNVTTKHVEIEFGPDKPRVPGLIFGGNSFSTGSAGTLNVNNLHEFGPTDWKFVHLNKETIPNQHFVCPKCELLSGAVVRTECGETDQVVHVIECQECNARLYPLIAQTA